VACLSNSRPSRSEKRNRTYNAAIVIPFPTDGGMRDGFSGGRCLLPLSEPLNGEAGQVPVSNCGNGVRKRLTFVNAGLDTNVVAWASTFPRRKKHSPQSDHNTGAGIYILGSSAEPRCLIRQRTTRFVISQIAGQERVWIRALHSAASI
jgi:hypothetical protein